MPNPPRRFHIDQPHHGRLADVRTVGHDQPVRADLADGRNERTGNLDGAIVILHPWWLVEEVEGKLRGGDVLVALCEEAPVVHGGLECPLHRIPRAIEEQEGLEFAAIHAIAGDAVKVQVDVDTVLATELDRLVDGG